MNEISVPHNSELQNTGLGAIQALSIHGVLQMKKRRILHEKSGVLRGKSRISKLISARKSLYAASDTLGKPANAIANSASL